MSEVAGAGPPDAAEPGVAEAALEAELAVLTSVAGAAPFAAGVRDALGADISAPLPSDVGLVAHLIQVRDGVLAAYLLVEGGLIVHEAAADGSSLTVAIPAFRLARVEVRRRPDGAVRAAFELDADVATTRAAGDGNVTEHAAYVVIGEAESALAVAAFATEVRCLLVGL